MTSQVSAHIGSAPARSGIGAPAIFIAVIALGIVAPFLGLYPILLMKLLCFALFACAFNLLIGFVGLLSFGHAMFFGSAAYAACYAMRSWGFTPELGLIFGVEIGRAHV